MRNDVDEMFEVSDFDEDVKLREEILKEVRELQLSEDWNEDFKTVMDIQENGEESIIGNPLMKIL